MAVQKVEGLIVEVTGDDRLVYNDADGSAHVLNTMANRVFELCDGSVGAEQIAERLSADSPEPVTLDIVWLALEELSEAGLVVVDEPVQRHVNRRELIIKFGVGAAAAAMLPVVEMIVSPDTSSTAALPLGQPTQTPTPRPTTATPTPRPVTSSPTPAPTPDNHHQEFWERIHSWWEQISTKWSRWFRR